MPTYKSDIEIAREVELSPIWEIASQIGITRDELILHGDHIAKIKNTAVRRRLDTNPDKGKLILVSAITPTPAGEGKTTVSIGLTQALHLLNKKVSAALREPSLGPTLGVKGGAAGGGQAQVLPMEDINLHFTGDIHAVTSAHNLIAAAIDNHIHFGNELKIAANQITWPRVMDMNDRALRDVVVGLGGKPNGYPRQTGFDITAASEIMAILCLASDFDDLKLRISNIVIGYNMDGQPVKVSDLKVQGTVATLLKEAFQPNLVQAIGGAPVFIHGGPFANIAQGANSILATNLAMVCSDYVVTEAGFGFDLGGEKFLDIVSPYGGFQPSVVVLVATIRALKMHGGIAKTDLTIPNVEAVEKGEENLKKHIENVRAFGIEPVIALNRFVTDTDEEINAVKTMCKSVNAHCVPVNYWEEGGKGGLELGEIVADLADHGESNYQPLYTPEHSIEEKIEIVAKTIYGADGVEFQPKAKKGIKTLNDFGYGKLPVCISKTQNSLSDDPKKIGRPTGFTISVRDVIVSAGAGFIVALTGELMRMPGLPKVPAAEKIDIDSDGNISGLF